MKGILLYAFQLHAQQALQRKLDAMTDEDWKRLEEEQRINEEWAEHNPSVYLRSSRDPSEFKGRLVSVVAGPLGYYGSLQKWFLGPRRDTIEEARADAEQVEDLVLAAGFAGLQFGYSQLCNFA